MDKARDHGVDKEVIADASGPIVSGPKNYKKIGSQDNKGGKRSRS